MVGFLIALFIIGAIAGYVARLLVPGRDPMSFGGTVLVGVVGSFIGGFLGWALFGNDAQDGALQTSGIIGSVVGAVIVLLLFNSGDSRRSSRI